MINLGIRMHAWRDEIYMFANMTRDAVFIAGYMNSSGSPMFVEPIFRSKELFGLSHCSLNAR